MEVFAKTVEPMLKRLFEGYNQTVFAYGQTGSGKTFTMGGEYGKQIDAHLEGIIPRVADKIFETISELQDYKINARVSYFELYKEDIRDLLKPETDVKLLQVNKQKCLNFHFFCCEKSIFGQIFNFWPNFQLLAKFQFWSFLVKFSIFGQVFNFWSNFQFSPNF